MNDNDDRQVGRRPMHLGVRAFVKENGHEEEAVSMQELVRVRRAKADRSRRCDNLEGR